MQLNSYLKPKPKTQGPSMENPKLDISEADRLRSEMAEQEAHWKEAYDVLMAENTVLKSTGSEAMLASQWRQRYDTVLKEKDDIENKLKMELQKKGGSSDSDGKYEMKYRDLKESFRLYRKKAKEIFEAQQSGENGVSSKQNVIDANAMNTQTNDVLFLFARFANSPSFSLPNLFFFAAIATYWSR